MQTGAVCGLAVSLLYSHFYHDADGPLARGALAGGRVMMCPLATRDESVPAWGGADARLAVADADIATGGGRRAYTSSVVVENERPMPILHRWQFDAKNVYAVTYKCDPYHGSDLSILGKSIVCIGRDDGFVANGGAAGPKGTAGGVADTPVREYVRAPDLRGFSPFAPNALYTRDCYLYFDYVPVGSGRYEWYTCGTSGNDILLTRSDYPRPRQRGGADWLEVSRWTADFCAPFFVATSKDDRFFVTDAGHIYTPPPTVHGPPCRTPARLRKVWLGLPPVNALIHDADNAKWYAFTKDSYFELADPIRPKPHAIRVQRPKTADDALTTAAACGRVIRGLPEPKGK